MSRLSRGRAEPGHIPREGTMCKGLKVLGLFEEITVANVTEI